MTKCVALPWVKPRQTRRPLLRTILVVTALAVLGGYLVLSFWRLTLQRMGP
jgi:hypothetical protein